MKFIADFHIHSKYSRATSKDMDIPHIARWASWKGIQLIGTGDFTHQLWLNELNKHLRPSERGIYENEGIKFILTAEVNNIYFREGKTHKVHNLIFAPDFDTVNQINGLLSRYGSLISDGRPILSCDSQDLLRMLLDLNSDILLIPAHIWTPHFSLFGSNSGFNQIQECFGEDSKYIYAMETGLSSDPAMNWRVSALDKISLISNSDAHSPQKIGREANLFDCSLDYPTILEVLKTKDKTRFILTIEFYPEEGKYHYDGHRNCQVRLHPQETIKSKNLCPQCKRPVTIGVLHRVEQLAVRQEGEKPASAIPYVSLIPLDEIIAESFDLGKGTVRVNKEYMDIVTRIGTEFDVLMNIKEDILYRTLPERLAEGIVRVRHGEVDILPGYDGEFGTIKIRWAKKKVSSLPTVTEQMLLFE